jgi:hypothetical protein
MRKDVKPARARNHRSQLCNGERAKKRIDSPDDPNQDKEPGVLQVSRDLTGGAEDTHPDSPADGDRKAKANAENPQQAPTIVS